MGGQHVAGPPKALSATEAAATVSVTTGPNEPIRVEFGRGLSTLVTAAPLLKEERKTAVLLPAWFFFAADVLLLAFTASICSDAAWDFGTIAFCFISVSLALLLGLAGVLRSASHATEPSEPGH